MTPPHRRAPAASLGLHALLVLLGVAATLALAPSVRPTPAGAQAENPTRLGLTDQSAAVAPDGDFTLGIAVDRPPPGAVVRPTLHGRVSGRLQFDQSLDSERLGPVFSTGPQVPLDGGPPVQETGWRASVTTDPVTGDDLVEISLATRDDGPFDEARTRVADPGVYPLAIELLDADGEPIDELVTHLVRLPEPDDDSSPLAVSLVVPVHAPVSQSPDGTTAVDDAALSAIDDVIVALSENPDVPLSVAPTPETIASLGSTAQPDGPVLRDLLADSLRGRQVLAGPYVDLDATSFVQTGLEDELTAQVTTGADALGTQLGVRPDGRTWLAGPTTTPETLAQLRELGVDQVVLPEEILTPLGEDFRVTLAQTFDVTTSAGTTQRAVAADEGLRAHVGSTGDGVLDAHRLLADLAVLHYDRPAAARGVVVSLPDQDLPPAFLDTLLAGLPDATLVAPVTLDTLFRDTATAGQGGADDQEGPPLVRTLTPLPPEPLGSYPAEVLEARRQLDGFESLVGVDNPDVGRLDRTILTAAAAGMPGARRQEYLDAASAAIDGSTAAVSAEQQGVTITDRSGTIPVAVHNELDDDVTVTIQLASDKLEFPDGALITQTVPPGTTTIDVRVDTRASGAFPVDLRMTSPDGSITLADERFTVRSTAVSGLGVVLSVVAALFLALWWARHFRSARRAGRLVSANHPAARADAKRTQDRFLEDIEP